MAVADRNALPVSVYVESATPHEATLAISTLLQLVRHLVVRYERHADNFLGMLHLASSLILLRHL
jgi:hypothetical protein